jgi:hypothetical protein
MLQLPKKIKNGILGRMPFLIQELLRFRITGR